MLFLSISCEVAAQMTLVLTWNYGMKDQNDMHLRSTSTNFMVEA